MNFFSESSKLRFLVLPSDNTRQCTCPLVVGFHQGEGVQDLLPLSEVVNVLEGSMVGVVEEVKDDHDSVVSKGGGGSCKTFSSTLLQQLLKRLQPLWQEFTKIFFHLQKQYYLSIEVSSSEDDGNYDKK